ncbi:MAG TPA: hypothetical protein DEB31_01640 [Clostridiales bacterium]|nr:hypothetical protein [Clostridiales bacterium]
MTDDISAREYFLSKRPASGPARKAYSRIANAMLYCGDISMRALCEMPEKQLKRLRNIGEQTLEVLRSECRAFRVGAGESDKQ